MVAEAATANDPFTWSDVRRRHPGASERVFAAAAEFGWIDGLVVPIRVSEPSGGQHGLASLAGGDLSGLDEAAWAAVVASTRTAFECAKVLVHRQLTPGSPTRLGLREQQALRLCADGLSDSGIAEAMGVAPATAHFHVERAKRALGATTRSQAVALAVSRNLI